ncbi:AAA family ATPase [Bacillus infantis]|uniref:AAA family ATPase n=1 Tax=Bacillus infantis TaxID=324767 RepID=UPI0020039D12|nr:AAA family ATPase [Bacillus infantis]MCK6204131.1 AAA family ATPase [Bacillus infantis]
MMEFDDGHYFKSIILRRNDIPSYSRYPFSLPAVKNLDNLPLHPDVTFIVGENGMGKSTLLEAIAIAAGFNPEGGSLNFSFSTHNSHSELEQYIRLSRGSERPEDGFFLRAESFYNVASYIDDLDKESPGIPLIESFGGTSLHEQSHGEAFFATFLNRFRGKGIYILDEPEAALSPLRQLSMVSRIHELAKDRSQFIIATHSPIIMSYPSAKIIELTEEGGQVVRLEDTGHYQFMKQFFENRERMLHHLLEE